jgi:hypothetical protein
VTGSKGVLTGLTGTAHWTTQSIFVTVTKQTANVSVLSKRRWYMIHSRESWEVWADDYQDYWEAKGNYAEEFVDDIEAYKQERDEGLTDD